MKTLSLLLRKPSPAFYFSGAFFLVSMSLDLFATNTLSGGNLVYEGNAVAKLIWQMFGSFRYVEIPIWVAVVFGMAYLINTKSKFLALMWLNLLAFNHLLGFISWLPFGILDFSYAIIKHDWAMPYFYSLISICLSLPAAFLQIWFERKKVQV